MKQNEMASLAMQYFEKMRVNYQNTENLVITPENVFQKSVRYNYDLFMELIEHLMLPGSGFRGAENLLEALPLLEKCKSVLFLMKHVGNFDVPCFYALLSREGEKYQDILDRLVFIAGRKLNEESMVVKTFTEIFSRIVIVPNRDIPLKTENETPAQRAYREEMVRDASRINRAAMREMRRLKKEGYIIVLFPMGGRPKPGLVNQGVKETTSYMRLFDYVYFIEMQGNLLPVGEKMEQETPRQDNVVLIACGPVSTEHYLAESRRLFDAQKKEENFEQFNVDRVMGEIGHADHETDPMSRF